MQLTQTFLARLQKAYSVVVMTGSGISAASVVPTFRGKDGLWKNYQPHELASLDAFTRQPEVVWEWYRWRRNIIRNAQPNPGHFTLTEFPKYFPEFHLITQNVDGLHRRAGSQKIIELHGNIMRNKCIDCTYLGEADGEDESQPVPECPKCSGKLRPDVVWFGETLPMDEVTEAQRVSQETEIFFSIGTSSLVEPAASLAYLAKGNGAYLVEINPDETPLSSVANERFPFAVEKFLPALEMVIKKLRKPVA